MQPGGILWVFATVVKMLFGTTAFHTGVSGFDFWLQSNSSFLFTLLMHILGGGR